MQIIIPVFLLYVLFQSFGHVACFQEVLVFDMNHFDIPSHTQYVSYATTLICDGSNSSFQMCLKSINTQIKVKYFLIPNRKWNIEYEFTIGPQTAGYLNIEDITSTYNGGSLISIQAYSVSDDSFSLTNEMCMKSYYSKFFRGSQEFEQSDIMDLNFKLTDTQYPYTMNFLRAFVIPCHPSCKGCDQSNPDICTKCSQGVVVGGKCSCPAGLKFQNGNCVTACNTPEYFLTSNSNCIFNPKCKVADIDGVCTTCNSSEFLSYGICAKSCSQGQLLQLIGGFKYCIPQPYTMAAVELLSDFYEDSFSSYSVRQKGYSVTVGVGVSSKFTITQYCRGVQLILGWISGRINANISFKKMIDLKYYTHVQFSFRYYLIDSGPSTANVKIQVQMNLEIFSIDTTGLLQDNLCGVENGDYVGVFSKYFQFPAAVSPGSGGSGQQQLNVRIDNLSTNNVQLGVREIHLLGYNCNNKQNCVSCSLNECKVCAAGYGLDGSKNCILCDKGVVILNECKPCHPLCDTCFGTAEYYCYTCKLTSQKFNSSTCLACKVGQFYQSNACNPCDANCYQCQTAAQICISCLAGKYVVDSKCVECKEENGFVLIGQTCSKCDPTCLTCSGTANTNCKTCINGQYLTTLNKCENCPLPNCDLCGNGGVCTKCKGSLKLKLGICDYCNTSAGWFIRGEECLQCHSSCASCSNTTELDCLTCSVDYYYFPEFTKCLRCPNTSEYANSSASCHSCFTQCKLCMDLNPNLGYTTSDYCTYCACQNCNGNIPTFQGLCVGSCSIPGKNLILDTTHNTCVCPKILPVLVDVNSEYYCAIESPFGFFCPLNSITPCIECVANCEKCETRTTCKLCGSGTYYWKGKCHSQCFKQLSITENTINRTCECSSGKILTKRNASAIAAIFPNEDEECLEELKLRKLEIMNSLSRSSSRENIPTGSISNNYFILTYNRRPTDYEFATFEFYIMKEKLIKNNDYMIIKQMIEADTPSILVEISIVQNIKVTEISSMILKKYSKFTLLNSLLIKKSLSETMSGETALTSGIESISRVLVNSSSGFVRHLMSYSREIQILCALSNFVQVLTPIFFLHLDLPPIIKYGSLLGAAFIFDTVPSQQEVDFNEESQDVTQARLLSNNQSTSKVHDSSYESKLAHMISGFGLTPNIFHSFLIIHIMIFASVLLMVICYTGRRMFKGKQYTVYVIEKISNIVTQQLQSSITLILSMISLCLCTGEGLEIAIIYLVMYSAFYIQVAYLTFFKPTEYLFEKMPNFFVDVNYKKKGAKWSLLIQLCKKHLVIIFLLTLYDDPITCCAFVACFFFLSALYYGYYRFFTHQLITIAKLIQELIVGMLFILIAVTINLYDQAINSTPISDEDLLQTTGLSNYILITIVICICISFIFSTYRFIMTIKDFINTIKKDYQEKIEVQKEIELLFFSTIVQSKSNFVTSRDKYTKFDSVNQNSLPFHQKIL